MLWIRPKFKLMIFKSHIARHKSQEASLIDGDIAVRLKRERLKRKKLKRKRSDKIAMITQYFTKLNGILSDHLYIVLFSNFFIVIFMKYSKSFFKILKLLFFIDNSSRIIKFFTNQVKQSATQQQQRTPPTTMQHFFKQPCSYFGVP